MNGAARGREVAAVDPAQDSALFATIRDQLFSAVVGDVLDVAGFTHQFLPPRIQPLLPGRTLVGRAMPVLEADLPLDRADDARHEPFGRMMEALDDLRPGEIYLCTGSRGAYALFGGLMARRASHLGAAGAVVDGYCRDTPELATLDFPVFSHGSYAQDQGVRGHVVDFRVPIQFGNGARVDPGDILLADADGVVAIPQHCAPAVVAAAVHKVRGESLVRADLEQGVSARDVFRRRGIL